jgi:hypothetical protein
MFRQKWPWSGNGYVVSEFQNLEEITDVFCHVKSQSGFMVSCSCFVTFSSMGANGEKGTRIRNLTELIKQTVSSTPTLPYCYYVPIAFAGRV